MTAAQARSLLRLRRQVSHLRSALDRDFLAHSYRNFLYGGWRHPSGRWVSAGHEGLQRFHEACKARFCPYCTKCSKHRDECACGASQSLCWAHVGSCPVREEAGGPGETAKLTCPQHGKTPWRRTLYYTVVAAFPSNKWAKTAGAAAEFAAGVLGYRPWDDTLSTIPAGSGRIHLVVCQTFSTSALLTIAPLLEKYLKGTIIKPITTTSNTLSGWLVRASDGVGQDILKLASQDQHYRTTSSVSPLEGVNPIQLWWDEPMEGDIRATATRGLLPALGLGAGTELISATLLEGSAKAAAYMRGEIWDKAWIHGGESRDVFAMTGTMWDNPAYTAEDVRVTLERFPPWEREARAYGTASYRRGLIIPDFSPDTHTYRAKDWDPLVERGSDTPTPHPIYMAVDPHDVRPWVMVWIMLEENYRLDEAGRKVHYARVIREWPEGSFRDMRHFSHAEPGFGGAYTDYGRIIERIEKGIPGGAARIRGRFMDPAFGDSQKAGSGDTVAKQMAKVGYRFTTNIPREVEPGHNILRAMVRGSWTPGQPIDDLHFPHLLVEENCRNTVWAFLNYVNDDGKNPTRQRERPGEAGKDQIDVLRYIFVMHPAYHDWRRSDRWYSDQVARLSGGAR